MSIKTFFISIDIYIQISLNTRYYSLNRQGMSQAPQWEAVFFIPHFYTVFCSLLHVLFSTMFIFVFVFCILSNGVLPSSSPGATQITYLQCFIYDMYLMYHRTSSGFSKQHHIVNSNWICCPWCCFFFFVVPAYWGGRWKRCYSDTGTCGWDEILWRSDTEMTI